MSILVFGIYYCNGPTWLILLSDWVGFNYREQKTVSGITIHQKATYFVKDKSKGTL